MGFLFRDPYDWILAVLCLSLAVAAFVRGTRLLSRGLKNPEHPLQTLWVVRGFRGGIVALAILSFAGGFYYHKTWPLVLGAVFLGEELLETGIMILALRRQERHRREED